MWSLGLRLQQPLAFQLWLLLICLCASKEGGPYAATSLLSFGIHSILCCVSTPGVTMQHESLLQEKSFFVCLFFFVSQAIPQIGLLSRISSLRLSWGHSGWPFTLRTNDATCTSLPRPHLLVADSHRHICERVSYCVETALPSLLPPQDGTVSLNLLSLFLSFIFCPVSFLRDWTAFLGAWCPLLASRSCSVEVAKHPNDLLVNLWGRKWSPHSTPSSSLDCPLSMGFYKWKFWSGLPLPSLGDLPNPGIEPTSLSLLNCRQIPSH